MADEEIEQDQAAEQMPVEASDDSMSEGFREQLGQPDATLSSDDEMIGADEADASIDSDMDYDTDGAEADDVQYPSM